MRWVAVLMVLVATGPPVFAQSPPVEPGSRIRALALAPSGGALPRVEGVVDRVAGDTLFLRAMGPTPARLVTMSGQVRIFVYQGRRAQPARGAVVGGVTGLVMSGLVGAVSGRQCDRDEILCTSRKQVAAARSVTLTAAGAAAGLAIGALVGRQVWLPVGPGSIQPLAALGHRGGEMGLRMRIELGRRGAR